MRKSISIVLVSFCILLLLSTVAFSIFVIVDTNRLLDDLRSHNASGHEYLPVYFGLTVCGMIVLFFSAIGLTVSAVNIKVARGKAVKRISFFAALAFTLFVLVSICGLLLIF